MNEKALRACAKYDPTKRVINVGNDGSQAYLPLSERMAWFHCYLQEQGKLGMIDDSALTYLPDACLLLGVSSVYIDGALAGKSCGGALYSPMGNSNQTVGQEVAGMAKGRALSNAGFGTADAIDPPPFASENNAVDMDAIKACSYDPIPDMAFISSDDGREPQPFLSVAHRVKWFHQWLKDNHLSGYIDDSQVAYEPNAKLLIARAEVVVDGRVVGTSCATYPYDPDFRISTEYNPVGTVCTKAKGRALANAGFGVNVLGAGDESDMLNPCESGIPTGEPPIPVIPPLKQAAPVTTATKVEPSTEVAVAQPAVEPVAPAAPETQPESPKPKRRGRPPKAKPVEAPEEPKAENEKSENSDMTREEALRYVVPVGKMQGMTIGEALGMNRGMIEFYGSDRFTNPKYGEFKRAAAIAVGEV